MAKKKTSKKSAKKKNVPKTPQELFNDWWNKVAEKKVSKIEKKWIKENAPNEPDEEEGGDHWHVNELMHNGDAHEMTYEIAQEIFIIGHKQEPWVMSQSDSLYCDLDEVIQMAYEAGKKTK